MKYNSITICIVAVLLLVLPACKSKQQAATPHAAWLQEKMEVLNERYSEVRVYELNGATYYSIFVKGPDRSFDMNRTTIYDADGNVYLSLGGPRKRSEKELNFFRDATYKGVIWQSDVMKEKESSTTHQEESIQ